MTKIFIKISLLFIFISFVSCEGDCRDEKIERVEWITNYVTKRKSKDTLVSYSILENKREYMKYSKEIKHSVTIHNNNDTYSNEFAVKINYGYIKNSDEYIKTNNYNYVEIAPNSSYTFTFYSQAGYNYNFNSSYEILQIPQRIKIIYQERIDELKIDTITVNSCEQNIETLKEKYKTIKNLYNSKHMYPKYIYDRRKFKNFKSLNKK